MLLNEEKSLLMLMHGLDFLLASSSLILKVFPLFQERWLVHMRIKLLSCILYLIWAFNNKLNLTHMLFNGPLLHFLNGQ